MEHRPATEIGSSAGRGKHRFKNVLISSAARKVPLLKTVLETVRRIDPAIAVFAGDLDRCAISKYVADGFIELPTIDDSNAGTILELCLSHAIGIVIPTRDGELAFWARHAAAFSRAGIAVVVSKPDAVAISLDKLRFAEYGAEAGFPTIPAWTTLRGAGRFVVKERYGAGSRTLGLNLDAQAALAHAQAFEAPIFQPFIAGTEISVDAWLTQTHQVKGLVLRTRDIVRNGESVVTSTFRSDPLEDLCTRLLESLPLHGPVVLQLIMDADDRPHVMELNARFGGASTIAIAAGLDIWYWTLLEAAGATLDHYPFQRIAGEVRQIRVPSDLYFYDSHF